MLGVKARCNSCELAPPALYARHTRVVETFTQTVTEVWIGNVMTKVVVTDTSQQLEANQEFSSTYSLHEPWVREVTACLSRVQREYPLLLQTYTRFD